MVCTQIHEERKGKKRSFPAIPRRTTIHGPHMEEEDTEKNPMMQQKRQNNHQIQPQTLLEVGGVVDVLASALYVPTTFSLFFYYTKLKIPPRPINNHKQTMKKLPQSP
jgi:hypothetical protein